MKNIKTLLEILTALYTFFNYNIYNVTKQTQLNCVKYDNNPILGNNITGSLFDPNVIKNDNKYKMYISWRNKKSIALSESIDGYNFTKVKEPVLTYEYDWEKQSVMNPHVIYDEEEKIYKMWYSAGEIYEPDVLGYATSNDGINWVKKNIPILKPSSDKTRLDNYKIGGCDVHKLSENEYIMFYIGYTDVDTGRIFEAKSKDGINWIRYPDPIIYSDKDKFDSESCYKPSAIYDEKSKTWMIWYNGRTKDREYIGLAYCK